eukprot:399053-Amphidinium_carterae.1
MARRNWQVYQKLVNSHYVQMPVSCPLFLQIHADEAAHSAMSLMTCSTRGARDCTYEPPDHCA